MTAAELIACPDCGKDNDDRHTFCSRCGKQLAGSAPPAPARVDPNVGFRWNWLGLSIILITGTVTIVSFLLDFVYRAVGGGEFAELLAFLTFGIGMVLGGIVAGHTSPGITVKEPAVAAALVTVLYAVASQQYAGLSWVWVLPFILAYLGAWLGEKMQGTI